jgi:hypothetical protein
MEHFKIYAIIVTTSLLCLPITYLSSLKKHNIIYFIRYFLLFLLITFSAHLGLFFFFPSQGDRTQFLPLVNNFVDRILSVVSGVLCIPGVILQYPVHYLSKLIIRGLGFNIYKYDNLLMYTSPTITSLIFSLYYSYKRSKKSNTYKAP